MQDLSKLVEHCYGTSADDALQYISGILDITGRLSIKEHRFHKPVHQFDIGQDLSGTVSTLMLYWNLDIDSQPNLDAISGKIELGSYLFFFEMGLCIKKDRPAHESKWIPGVLSRKSSVIVGGCRLAGGGGGGRGW